MGYARGKARHVLWLVRTAAHPRWFLATRVLLSELRSQERIGCAAPMRSRPNNRAGVDAGLARLFAFERPVPGTTHRGRSAATHAHIEGHRRISLSGCRASSWDVCMGLF